MHTFTVGTTLCLLLVGAATVAIYHFIIFPLFISPLAAIPGPKLAALSAWYLDLRYAADTAFPHLHLLFERYGPIVRVGPSEVIINDAQHISTIYGVRSRFLKPPTAQLFANYGVPNMFSSVDRDQHREHRQRVGKVYNMGTLLGNSGLVAYLGNRIDAFKDKIASAPGNVLDIYTLSVQFALDNVSFVVYGRGLDVLGGKNAELNSYIRHNAIASVSIVRFYKWIVALSIWPLSSLLPKFIRDSIASSASFESINKAEVEKAYNANSVHSEPDHSTVASLRSKRKEGASVGLIEIASECCDHVMAGADTTGISITYVLYNLALPEHASHQARLRTELSSVASDCDLKELCGLPFLDQYVYETLRLYSPGPGSLQQRTTPADSVTSIMVQGRTYILPAGTTVGALAYSAHRDTQVFGQDAAEFKPERWETSDETLLQKMKQSWIPFGSGARICIGKSLALIEIKALVASIIRDYIVELATDANRDDYEPVLGGVIRPKSEKCELILRALRK